MKKAAGDFLRKNFDSGDPLRMYVAFRIRNQYLREREPRDRLAACDRFIDKVSHFAVMFQQRSPLQYNSDTGRSEPFHISSRIWCSVPSTETRLDLWYPDNQQGMECVAAYASFYPLIPYYLNRLNDWDLCFRKCKVCGRIFLAKSQKYELCSDKCRRKQSLQNNREFDKRARENNYDLLYKNECQNWRNKINKAKKTADFQSDQLGEMMTTFEVFKKEALQRKKALNERTASSKEFMDWLYQQGNIIIELYERL